jgi:hypothetical protein
MSGADIVMLALLLAFGFALLDILLGELKKLFGLLKLVVMVPLGIVTAYFNHFAKLGPRNAALQEAGHGAAMIVLPVLALLRFGAVLPHWSSLAALALMICGGFRLFNGAKFSVGWRDPKLIARAALKIALAVMLFRAIDTRQFGPLRLGALPPMCNPFLSLLGWWLLVTGLTKLLLLLRGLPVPMIGNPGTPHGNAPFTNPHDAAQGLKK